MQACKNATLQPRAKPNPASLLTLYLLFLLSKHLPELQLCQFSLTVPFFFHGVALLAARKERKAF